MITSGGSSSATSGGPVERNGGAHQHAVPDPPLQDISTFDGLIKQTREPEFISSAYFLRFKFEEGKYALVGRETLDGLDVLRIEYYPARLFARHEPAPSDEPARRRRTRTRQRRSRR